MTKFVLRIEDSLYSKLKILAKEKNRSINSQIIYILRGVINKSKL